MRFTLQTDRLKLRTFDEIDALPLLKLNSDPLVMQFTGDLPFENIQQARQFIQSYDQYEKTGMGRWSVILKSNNEFIGWCGLKLNIDGKIDLGFRFLQQYWGYGYALEASKACLNYGFSELNLNEIIARTAVKNTRAQKVLEKLGMTKMHMFKYQNIGKCYFYSLVKPIKQ